MSKHAVRDTWAIDKIATLLGTNDEWSSADLLEMIAEIIGSVRPHPGSVPGSEYPALFQQATGRGVALDYDASGTGPVV